MRSSKVRSKSQNSSNTISSTPSTSFVARQDGNTSVDHSQNQMETIVQSLSLDHLNGTHTDDGFGEAAEDNFF